MRKEIELVGVDVVKKARGISKLINDYSIGVKYNNYNGMSTDFGITPALTASIASKSNYTMGLGLSLSTTDQNFTVSPNLSFAGKWKEDGDQFVKNGGRLSTSYTTREGLQGLTLSAYKAKEDNFVSKGFYNVGKHSSNMFSSSITHII